MTDPIPHVPDEILDEIQEAIDAETAWDATYYLPEPERPPRPEPWTPTDRRSAEWAMAIVRRDALEIAEQEADLAAWATRITQAHDTSVRPLKRRTERLTQALERYALVWHDADPRVNVTLSLPSGEVGTRTPKTPKVSITDRAAVVAWLESIDPEVVTDKVLKRPDPEPLVSGVAKLVEVVEKNGGWLVIDPASGEQIDGLAAELGETTAKAKPDTHRY